MQLRAHTENVIVQCVDDDVVLVDLQSGICYSLNGSAAVIFCALDSGCDADRISEYLHGCYSGAEIDSAKVQSFVQSLIDDKLVVPGVGNSGLNAQDFVESVYTSPFLNKYEDLQELLLLDPVRVLPSTDGES